MHYGGHKATNRIEELLRISYVTEIDQLFECSATEYRKHASNPPVRRITAVE